MPDRGIENRALNAVRARGRSPMNRLVVVGASLAGLRAVEAARKTGFVGDITLIGGERHLPYDRPPLSKEFLEATEPGVEARVPFFRSDDVFPELDVRAPSRPAGNGSGPCPQGRARGRSPDRL
jgi:hypothetical protein